MQQPEPLLKAAEILAMEPVHSVHALNPLAIRQRKSLGDPTGLTQLGVHWVRLMPGHASSEYHRHLYEEEAVYVLAGHGEALIDEQAQPIGAGDFLGFARGGAAHVIVNNSEAALDLLVMGQRLEHDVCEYPHHALRLYIAGKHEAWQSWDASDHIQPT